MTGLPEPVQKFMADEDGKRRFPEFHAAVVAHCVEYLYPDGNVEKKPHFRRTLIMNAFARAAARATRLAIEGVGMTAKVSTGEKTLAKGRVLEVGTVISMIPVFCGGTRVRNSLRMTRPDGRTVTRFVNITRVHRWADRKVD